MTIENTLLQRHSTRVFLPTAVDTAIIQKILDLGQYGGCG